MREKLTKLFGSHLVNLNLLPDDAIVIDAGACEGRFIEDIQARIKNPYIYAIEPSILNIKKLEESKYMKIQLIKAALVGAKEPKEMVFNHIEGKPEWGNVNNLYVNHSSTIYKVNTINLDALLDMIPKKTIHYLKMDIEGSEVDVVGDMNESTADRIEQISMEVHIHQIKMTKKLEAIGYKTFWNEGELYATR